MQKRNHNNIKLQNYLNNRVFVTKSVTTKNSSDLGVVKKIIESDDNLHSLFTKEYVIKSLDSNFEYDSYHIETKEKSFVLKINQEDSDRILEKEYNVLCSLKNKGISPEAVHYSDVGAFCILVTSFEYSASFNHFSKEDLLFNIRTLANCVSYLHETNVENLQVFDLFDMTKYISDFESNLGGDYNSMLKNKNFKIYLNIRDSYLEDIFNLKSEQSNLCLAHTNYDKSRLLYRGGLIKLINFQFASKIDPMLDLALLFLYLDIPKKVQSIFLDQYVESFKTPLSKENCLSKIDFYKNNLAPKIILLKTTALRFYEEVLYGDERPKKYIKYIKNYESVREFIDEKNRDALDNIFYVY